MRIFTPGCLTTRCRGRQPILNKVNRVESMWVKRAIDISGATILLIATSPVLLVALALVRITMGKPLIFRQKRAGYHDRIFTLYKIRTMLPEVDASGSPISIGRRLTPI